MKAAIRFESLGIEIPLEEIYGEMEFESEAWLYKSRN